nr:uncharacterized protein LOC117220509 [Megalopta genalis]
MTSEDEVWVQTQITVTPEEDAMIREISHSAILSSSPDVPLDVEDKIVYRREFSQIPFLDTDSEYKIIDIKPPVSIDLFVPRQDEGIQTYLQGITDVRISQEYKDEATQTLYMASPCPPLEYYRDIMMSMQEVPMPTMKTTMAAETIISFPPDALLNDVAEELSAKKIKEEELEEFTSEFSDNEIANMMVPDILQFALARALWILDPRLHEVETSDKEVQTMIKYNNHTDIMIVDSETQTDLTCEPKDSNSKLLSNYFETKNMIFDYLEDWLSKGIDAIAVVDGIMNEIIDKCTEMIRFPMKDETMQTIVTYKLSGEKEQDILRRLRHGIVVDPMEATMVVPPLIDDLLESVCQIVSANAPKAVKCIMPTVLRRTMNIIDKLEELHTELQPKPLDDVLAARRKKILDSMSKAETETISTQTTIGGVSEVQKIKDKEVVCSICRRPSVCQYCAIEEDVPQDQPKMLRTQDILLAYKPCYIVTTLSEKEKSQTPPPPRPPLKKIFPPVRSILSTSMQSSRDSGETMNVFPEPDMMPRESVNEWSYVIDATLMKPVSIGGSHSSAGRTTSSLNNANSARYYQYPCARPKFVPSETVNALEILKNTFCSQENCITSSLEDISSCNLFKRKKVACVASSCKMCINRSSSSTDTCCLEQTCKPLSRLHLPTTNTCNQNMKSNDNFKIIPICLSHTSSSQR